MKVMRGGGAIREADAPLRWLYRVVDRCCFDVLRKRRRSLESPSDGEGTHAVHPALAIELRDAVVRMLHTLDETEMRIAVLLFVDGLSQGEIAEEMGVSRVTINKKIQGIRAGAEAWLGQAARAQEAAR